MENLEPALIWIAGICGAVATIWGLLEKANKPIKDLSSRIDKLEAQANTNSCKLANDHQSFAKQNDINILVLKSCSLLMKHCANNNHTGELSRQAAEIDNFVYQKSGSL